MLKKMTNDYKDALRFVDDYFQMEYTDFLNKYFAGEKKDISRNLSKEKIRRIVWIFIKTTARNHYR